MMEICNAYPSYLLMAYGADGFNTAVHSYESLLSLARSQGAVGGQNRGACRVCGQLGHLTKQCRNMQSTFFKPADAAASGTTNGKGVSAEALEAARANLLVLPDSVSDLESELSDSDSSSMPLLPAVVPGWTQKKWEKGDALNQGWEKEGGGRDWWPGACAHTCTGIHTVIHT